MRKLVVTACLAAALALPAAPAHASDPAGLKDCPPGYGGFVVYVLKAETHLFCFPWGP
jgi:hypothetical protein